MPVDAFAGALDRMARSYLITTKAVARHMVRQRSGVILQFGGSDATNASPNLGNVQIAFDMVEAMRRQWAAELAAHMVRMVTLKTGGIPETFPPIPEVEPAKQDMIDRTLLKRAATMAEVGAVAAFVASDHAACMTSTQVNITAGAFVD